MHFPILVKKQLPFWCQKDTVSGTTFGTLQYPLVVHLRIHFGTQNGAIPGSLLVSFPGQRWTISDPRRVRTETWPGRGMIPTTESPLHPGKLSGNNAGYHSGSAMATATLSYGVSLPCICHVEHKETPGNATDRERYGATEGDAPACHAIISRHFVAIPAARVRLVYRWQHCINLWHQSCRHINKLNPSFNNWGNKTT